MGEFDRGKAAEHAARLLGASTRYVEAAKRVRRICPDMLVHVLHGKISLFDAQLTLKMPCTMVQGFLDQLSQMRPGDVFPLKRIVREHLARAINAGADFPNPCWGISLPEAFNLEGTADWHEVRYIIWNKQIAALDNGEEIPFPIAGRPCLVRVNPNPTTMEAATARGDLILPE
jgi:hypothetical protein